MKNKLSELLFPFLIGAAVYPVIEIIYRGYTHISMAFAGGVCMVLIFLTDTAFASSHIAMKAIMSALAVTVTEFIFGVILNIFLSLGIWDYSGEPMNIMGQVCLKYFFMWVLLSLPALLLCSLLRKAEKRLSRHE